MAGFKERLIQFILRGRDELSPAAKQSTEAVEELKEATEGLNQALDSAKDARGLVNGLGNTKRSIEQTEATISRVNGSIVDLRDALDKNPDSVGLAQSLKEAERESSRLNRGLDRLKIQLADQEQAAKAAGVDTSNLAGEEKRLAEEIDKTKAAIAENNEQLKVLQREQAAAARAASDHASRAGAVEEALGKAGRRVLGLAAGIVSVNALLGLFASGLRLVRDGIASMLQTGDKYEGLETQLTALMGSIEGGEQATAWIKKFAKDTPLEVADVTEAFALLKTFGLDPMDGTLQAITDQSEKLGGGMERLNGITTALGQSWAKEKLQTEEILQLIERGVPVWDLLARVTGKNTTELQDLATKGKLGRDVIKALIDEMGRSAQGSAAANMSRLSGLVSNLTDLWSGFMDRIAKSGALDYVKGQLDNLITTIEQMDADGRLQVLAQGLSDAFVQSAEKVREFATGLLEVDFSRLAQDTGAWLSQFGQQIDTAVRWTTMLAAPFRVAGNLLTGFVSSAGTAFAAVGATALSVMSLVARAVPDAFGGEKLVAGLEAARDKVLDIGTSFAQQVAQDGEDLKATWDSVAGSAEESAERQADAVVAAARRGSQQLGQMSTDVEEHFRSNITSIENAMAAIRFSETVEQLEQVKKGLIAAKLEGRLTAEQFEQAMAALEQQRGFVSEAERSVDVTRQNEAAVAALREQQKLLSQEYFAGKLSLEQWQAQHNQASEEITRLTSTTAAAKVEIASLQDVEKAFSSASTVAQLKALQSALFEAYRDGTLTLDQFQAQHNRAAEMIKKLGAAAGEANPNLAKLDDGLASLTEVQQAISDAKTDVDINNIRAALRKLYGDGKISASEYNSELAKATQRQKELKGATDAGKKSQDERNASDREAIKTSEELRRESGRRMEEERRAGDQAMQDRRRGAEEAQKDMAAVEDFYGGVMTRAREPLAQLSEAALAAYDKLAGITTVDLALDTSGLEATTQSLQRASEALGQMEAAANTIGMSDFGRFMTDAMVRSQRLQVQYLQEKQALQQLLEGYEDGTLSARSFAQQAEQTRNSVRLLNDSDLRTLESAIDSAKDRMQQLGQSSQQTLNGLRDELDQLQGNQEDIERRRFASRRRELETQLDEARQSGDPNAMANLQRSLGLLRQIEAETAAQSERAAQQKRIEEVKAATPAPAPAAPSKVIRLETARGRAVEVAVGSESDETNLLSILEDAGLRSR